ncbi:YqgU-like beta propeller domain-containing protein [Bacillus sp. FSL K6-3431]|uniref:YqgU-like beta propeller domain-containing protein n=1 Tax=Bacillus sp. FSL K6-3431 TaxID=2921500 RepID=UPI0030F92015
MRRTLKGCLLIHILIVFLLSGCIEKTMDASPKHNPTDKSENESIVNLPVKSLPIDPGAFEKVYGWIDAKTIIYSYVEEEMYIVATHHLFNGDSKVVFTSPTPIVNVIIHPSQEKLLIHTSPYTHGAKIFITDLLGEITFSTEIDSYELAIEWDPKDSSQMFITAFFEDWTYDIHHLNLNNKEMTKVPHLHPFMKWMNHSVIEQRWKDNDGAFFAPLWKTSVDVDSHSELIKDTVFRFDVFSDYLMAIIVPENNKQVFEYQFFDFSMERKAILEMPNIMQYSDWLIPNYDYNVVENRFITIAPKNHGSLDNYNNGFKMIELDLHENTKRVLMEDIENKPFTCTPDGELCLYGFQLEELLNLKTKKIEKLVTDS